MSGVLGLVVGIFPSLPPLLKGLGHSSQQEVHAKGQKWEKLLFDKKNSRIAILALWPLPVHGFQKIFRPNDFSLSNMKDLLHNFVSGPSMCLSERMNWIISSFPRLISKILFVLDSWDHFGSLGCRIGKGSFFFYLTFWKNKQIICGPVWSYD